MVSNQNVLLFFYMDDCFLGTEAKRIFIGKELREIHQDLKTSSGINYNFQGLRRLEFILQYPITEHRKEMLELPRLLVELILSGCVKGRRFFRVFRNLLDSLTIDKLPVIVPLIRAGFVSEALSVGCSVEDMNFIHEEIYKLMFRDGGCESAISAIRECHGLCQNAVNRTIQEIQRNSRISDSNKYFEILCDLIAAPLKADPGSLDFLVFLLSNQPPTIPFLDAVCLGVERGFFLDDKIVGILRDLSIWYSRPGIIKAIVRVLRSLQIRDVGIEKEDISGFLEIAVKTVGEGGGELLGFLRESLSTESKIHSACETASLKLLESINGSVSKNWFIEFNACMSNDPFLDSLFIDKLIQWRKGSSEVLCEWIQGYKFRVINDDVKFILSEILTTSSDPDLLIAVTLIAVQFYDMYPLVENLYLKNIDSRVRLGVVTALIDLKVTNFAEKIIPFAFLDEEISVRLAAYKFAGKLDYYLSLVQKTAFALACTARFNELVSLLECTDCKIFPEINQIIKSQLNLLRNRRCRDELLSMLPDLARVCEPRHLFDFLAIELKDERNSESVKWGIVDFLEQLDSKDISTDDSFDDTEIESPHEEISILPFELGPTRAVSLGIWKELLSLKEEGLSVEIWDKWLSGLVAVIESADPMDRQGMIALTINVILESSLGVEELSSFNASCRLLEFTENPQSLIPVLKRLERLLVSGVVGNDLSFGIKYLAALRRQYPQLFSEYIPVFISSGHSEFSLLGTDIAEIIIDRKLQEFELKLETGFVVSADLVDLCRSFSYLVPGLLTYRIRRLVCRLNMKGFHKAGLLIEEAIAINRSSEKVLQNALIEEPLVHPSTAKFVQAIISGSSVATMSTNCLIRSLSSLLCERQPFVHLSVLSVFTAFNDEQKMEIGQMINEAILNGVGCNFKALTDTLAFCERAGCLIPVQSKLKVAAAELGGIDDKVISSRIPENDKSLNSDTFQVLLDCMRQNRETPLGSGLMRSSLIAALRFFSEKHSSGISLRVLLPFLRMFLQGEPGEWEFFFSAVSNESLFLLLPQLIGGFRATIDSDRFELLTNLVYRLGLSDPHRVIIPLLVSKNSMIRGERDTANKIIDRLKVGCSDLIGEYLTFTNELIRVSTSWAEMWVSGLEEASTLFFVQKDVKAMGEVLQRLHGVSRSADSLQEKAFCMTFGRDLEEAERWLEKGLSGTGDYSKAATDQAWRVYHKISVRLIRHVSSFGGELPLMSVSPLLASKKNWNIVIPYSGGIKLSCFKPIISVIRSKQKPRFVQMLGVNNHKYSFLLKGGDDLKLDERCMQLFTVLNQIVGEHLLTTYPVIPLSSSAGLVGWVEDCDTLHAAVSRVRESRNVLLLKEYEILKKINAETIEQKIDHFKKAIHSETQDELAFFIFAQDGRWLERRRNFTKTLAAYSVVGYLLGLGDRHPSNIMISRKDGKIVHIDFCDIFEINSTRRRFPEKVPFRLTRMLQIALGSDLIDFKFECERILSKLRDPEIITLFDAIFNDPSIIWHFAGFVETSTSSSEIESDRQSGAPTLLSVPTNAVLSVSADHSDQDISEDEEDPASIERLKRARNFEMKRALGPDGVNAHGSLMQLTANAIFKRINQKLSGDDFSSVQDQVEHLIREATSMENLCQAYVGWCPFW